MTTASRSGADPRTFDLTTVGGTLPVADADKAAPRWEPGVDPLAEVAGTGRFTGQLTRSQFSYSRWGWSYCTA